MGEGLEEQVFRCCWLLFRGYVIYASRLIFIHFTIRNSFGPIIIIESAVLSVFLEVSLSISETFFYSFGIIFSIWRYFTIFLLTPFPLTDDSVKNNETKQTSIEVWLWWKDISTEFTIGLNCFQFYLVLFIKPFTQRFIKLLQNSLVNKICFQYGFSWIEVWIVMKWFDKMYENKPNKLGNLSHFPSNPTLKILNILCTHTINLSSVLIDYIVHSLDGW